MLSKIAEDSIECRFSVDVSCGQRLEVRFKSHDFVAVFEDGSELYKCSLLGPPSLHSYATGEAELRRGKGPLITLYHHTTQDSKNRILEGGAFRLSHWNIQGTDKTVKNVGYVYFTALDRITCDEDLKCIAMSSDAVIYLVIDGFSPPNLLSAEILERHSQSILPLKVYRGSTSDRQATLAFQVDATTLAPQHLLLHTGDLPMWYEICNPFTHRIGVVPDNQLCFRGSVIERGSFPSKTFAYLVVGDASSVVGLAAPYDEETTEAIFKIEPPRPAAPLLNVWFDDGNTDLYSTKRPELQSFDQHR
jgi:hypothetical protein